MHNENVLPEWIREDLASTWRLTDVLSRVNVDCNELSAPRARFAVMSAIKACRRCRNGFRCVRWSQCHEEGEENKLPEYCGAARLILAAIASGDTRPDHSAPEREMTLWPHRA